jgi:hypothetical protein
MPPGADAPWLVVGAHGSLALEDPGARREREREWDRAARMGPRAGTGGSPGDAARHVRVRLGRHGVAAEWAVDTRGEHRWQRARSLSSAGE